MKNKVEKKNLFKFDPAVADVLVAAEDLDLIFARHELLLRRVGKSNSLRLLKFRCDRRKRSG